MCKVCGNTHFELNQCTNCGTEKTNTKRIARPFMVVATSDSFGADMLILTKAGWVSIVGCDTKKTTHKRQTVNLKEFINNPPYGYTVKIDML